MRNLFVAALLVLTTVGVVSASDRYTLSALQQSASDSQTQKPPPQYSCERLDKVPASQRCAFIRANCESDSRIPYTEWYYCHVAPAGVASSFFFTVLLAALLPLYFTLLGDTAEIYFSPIMTHISQSIPKMRPRFAGVTFVAMGNGATDLSANISAIRNGDVLLSAGALTGAAMFVQCIVASEVMRASRGPVKCHGATLRDVGIYSVSILMVLAAFAHGKITYWFIAGAVLLYMLYAVWVFVGDEWHERGRPQAGMLWHSFSTTMKDRLRSFRGRQQEDMLPWAEVDMGPAGTASGGGGGGGQDGELSAPLVALEGGISSRPGSPGQAPPGRLGPGRGGRGASSQATTGHHHHHHRHHHLISAKAYQDMVWADLNPEEPGLAGLDGEDGGEAERRRRRRRQRQRRRGRSGRRSAPGVSYGGQTGRGAAAGAAVAAVEMGPAAGAGGEGYRPPGTPRTPAFASTASGGGGGGGGGGSQLVTLSSLDGSALAAPAPFDAAPPAAPPPGAPGSAFAALAADSTASGFGAGGGEAGSTGGYGIRATTSGRTRSLGTAMEVASSGGRITPVTERDAWVTSGGASASDSGTDSYDDDDDEESGEDEDEEAGLLGPRGQGRHGAGGGRGGWGGGAEGEASGSDEESLPSSRQGGEEDGLRRWARLWRKMRYELTVGTSAEWSDLPPRSLRRRWRTVTFPLLLPAYTAIRLTIPFVDPATYSRPWLLVTCVGAPLLFAAYVNPGSILAAGIALAAGAALCAAVAYLTAGEEDALPDLDLGTGFAFGPAFFAVFGFIMGIIWIGTLASEAVGVISLLASLLRIPASVMGLTLLAWGNSLGDLFSNPAMARRGQPTMALTACFAGPLFNMLTSMAFGFASYFAKRHVASAAVVLRPEVALGCVFLVVYNVAVAAAGLMNRGSLPERFYVFARLWYGAYFTIACTLGLLSGQG